MICSISLHLNVLCILIVEGISAGPHESSESHANEKRRFIYRNEFSYIKYTFGHQVDETGQLAYTDVSLQSLATRSTEGVYRHLALLNREAMQGLPVLPAYQRGSQDTPRVPSLERLAVESAIKQVSKKTKELQQRNYGCSFDVDYFGGWPPRLTRYRLNLTTNNISMGFSISSIEVAGYSDSASGSIAGNDRSLEVDLEVLRNIEKTGNSYIQKTSKREESIKTLRDACNSFMIDLRGIDPKRWRDARCKCYHSCCGTKRRIISYARSILQMPPNINEYTTEQDIHFLLAHLPGKPDETLGVTRSTLLKLARRRLPLKKRCGLFCI